MEDCWDQDAEARLTAQCAEERLWDLSLLTTHSHRYTHTHTLTHTHPNNDLMPGPSLRNPSQGHWPPQEDLQVGVVKNLQGDGGPAESSERNRNSINYERQQVQVSIKLYLSYIYYIQLYIYYIQLYVLYIYYIKLYVLYIYYIQLYVLYIYYIKLYVLYIYYIKLYVLNIYYIQLYVLYIYYIQF